ncbi:hypothetical protein HDV01_002035 [Terramyces sp. JEL0728]|nr:hypothetical protein HDV01_002035 [Terramyces sp. JEL0728]
MEKRKVFKQALSSPYVIKWNQISVEQENSVLSELESVDKAKLIVGLKNLTEILQDESKKSTVKSILFCKGDLPIMAYNHLPALCYNSVKLVPLLRNSQAKLDEIVGKNNMCAVGITNDREFEMLNHLIDGFVDYLDVPWMDGKGYISTNIKIIETTQGQVKKNRTSAPSASKTNKSDTQKEKQSKKLKTK